MQFPTIPSQRVTPVVRTDVTEVSPVKPVSTAQPQPVLPPPGGPAAAAQPAPLAPPEVERRQGSRRGPDRRRQQIPVLLDTRSGRDRRGSRRRADDPPPGRLNERA